MARLTEVMEQYSLAEHLAALAQGPAAMQGLRGGRRVEGLQYPAHHPINGFCSVIPHDAVLRDQRDLVTTSGDAGGNLIGKPIVAEGTSLRGASVVADAGCTMFPLGAGAAAVAVSGGVTGAFVDPEGAAAAVGEPTFSQYDLTPVTIALQANFARRLLKQGVIADPMVRKEMRLGIAKALDGGVLHGTGANGQPAGLATLAGVIKPSGTALSYASLLDTVRQIAATGARLSDLAFVAGTQAWETLSARERGSGYVIEDGRINGIPVFVSAEATSDALFVGPWSEVVVGVYGPGLSVLVDPRTSAALTHRVSMFLDVGIVCRQPASFAYVASIT